MEDFKKYDSESEYTCAGVRLAKDPDVRETAGGNLVTLTFVDTSRAEGDSDLWVEAKVSDRQADLAAHLQKGDTLHLVKGKPTIRRYGENNEKFSFQLRRASFVLPITSFATVKERGWTPGASKPAKVGKVGKQPARKPARATIDDDIPF